MLTLVPLLPLLLLLLPAVYTGAFWVIVRALFTLMWISLLCGPLVMCAAAPAPASMLPLATCPPACLIAHVPLLLPPQPLPPAAAPSPPPHLPAAWANCRNYLNARSTLDEQQRYQQYLRQQQLRKQQNNARAFAAWSMYPDSNRL